jgi:uncharacterized protein (DUF1697 family)
VTRYAALLRGINVGGRTRVAMADLRALFADLGYDDARTYLQSGNVVFTGPARAGGLAGRIEHGLETQLGVGVPVLLRTADELATVVEANPFVRRKAPSQALHVTFLASAASRARVEALEPPQGSTDEMAISGREVYVLCRNGYGRTKLTNAWLEKQLATVATTRNWKTVGMLRDLAAG